MVGFRNILVHQCEDFDVKIMVDVIEHHLGDLVDFTNYLWNAWRALRKDSRAWEIVEKALCDRACYC
jgi:uncharacterized protein YutE (UPF0331/DUF86 family)